MIDRRRFGVIGLIALAFAISPAVAETVSLDELRRGTHVHGLAVDRRFRRDDRGAVHRLLRGALQRRAVRLRPQRPPERARASGPLYSMSALFTPRSLFHKNFAWPIACGTLPIVVKNAKTRALRSSRPRARAPR